MAVLLAAVGLLAFTFVVQLAVWRLALPRRQTRGLLILFSVIPVLAFVGAWVSGRVPAFSLAQIVQIALFYVSYSLAYIVIYSAIENESPTLAIVSHVARAGGAGCPESELFERFGRGSTMRERFALMTQGGWVEDDGNAVRLTSHGLFFARFFELAARIFGIKKGG